jgi:hypothetical protein
MANKRIKDLDTEVTIANDADYIAVDGTGGTDASKKISVLNFQAQMRNNLTDAEMAILDGATVTTAELNILDGVTATTAELNILDGVTATAEELNIIDGVTATTEEINILDGVTATTAELNIMDGVTATTSELNSLDGFTGDYEDLNYAKELKDTGVTSTEYGKLDGVTTPLSGLNQALEANEVTITATRYDVNILDGVTATTAELNIMDGVTATTAELNYTDGAGSQLAGLDHGLGIRATEYTNTSATFTGSVYAICTATSANQAFTLPAINRSNLYRIIVYAASVSGVYSITITTNAADSGFIDTDGNSNGTTITLDATGKCVILESYGGAYWAITWGTGHSLT